MQEMIETFTALGTGLTIAWSVFIFLLVLYPKMYMFKQAGIATWLAFIPIIGDAMMLKVVGWSPWLYILFALIDLIPILGGVVMFFVNAAIYWKVAAKFGLGTLGKILSLFFNPITQWYIALTKKQYQG
jgi:hypothetical protein